MDNSDCTTSPTTAPATPPVYVCVVAEDSNTALAYIHQNRDIAGTDVHTVASTSARLAAEALRGRQFHRIVLLPGYDRGPYADAVLEQANMGLRPT